jgi:hypothetical protein
VDPPGFLVASPGGGLGFALVVEEILVQCGYHGAIVI